METGVGEGGGGAVAVAGRNGGTRGQWQRARNGDVGVTSPAADDLPHTHASYRYNPPTKDGGGGDGAMVSRNWGGVISAFPPHLLSSSRRRPTSHTLHDI